MTFAVGLLSILAFATAFSLCQIVRVARNAVSTALAALAVMRDPGLNDSARERLVRRASLTMLGSFVSILLRGAAVLILAFLPIVIADRLGIASASTVIELLSRWDVMLGASLILVVGLIFKERIWPSS